MNKKKTFRAFTTAIVSVFFLSFVYIDAGQADSSEKLAKKYASLANDYERIQWACFKNDLGTVKRLHEAGTSIQGDGKHYSCLQQAARWQFPELAHYLVGEGADLEYTTVSGSVSGEEHTALESAVSSRDIGMINLLVDAGADPRRSYTKLVKYRNSTHYKTGKLLLLGEEPGLNLAISALENSKYFKKKSRTNTPSTPQTPGAQASDSSVIQQLRDLARLKKEGVITDAEFKKLKNKLIDK